MIHSTTILAVRHRDRAVMAGDGQVTFGQTVVKQNARKIRRLYNDKILAGWNGLAISGLVAAWQATGHPPALALAIRIANFLVESLGITRTKYIEMTVGDIGGTILRSGNFDGRGRDFSAHHLRKMFRKKTSLCAVATPQINQRELGIGITLE